MKNYIKFEQLLLKAFRSTDGNSYSKFNTGITDPNEMTEFVKYCTKLSYKITFALPTKPKNTGYLVHISSNN